MMLMIFWEFFEKMFVLRIFFVLVLIIVLKVLWRFLFMWLWGIAVIGIFFIVYGSFKLAVWFLVKLICESVGVMNIVFGILRWFLSV